jgi:hypothetical protein
VLNVAGVGRREGLGDRGFQGEFVAVADSMDFEQQHFAEDLYDAWELLDAVEVTVQDRGAFGTTEFGGFAAHF